MITNLSGLTDSVLGRPSDARISWPETSGTVPVTSPRHKSQIALLILLLAWTGRGQDAQITFASDDLALAQGFAWAKTQAMAYVFRGNDPVGPWYEAALPRRQAFCMRDVSHQLVGAQLLGLADINQNLLSKFAAAIAESRDWCGYWEINKDNRPAPVDYKSDANFWYNLPANFDIIDACYRAWLWTGDTAYLTNSVFVAFYEKSLNEYVHRWDPDGDGLMEGTTNRGSSRGLSSYNEEKSGRVGVDLLAGQYIGNLRFAAMLNLRGNSAGAREYLARAERIRSTINHDWWDAQRQLYHHYILYDGGWLDDRQMMAFLLRWEVVPAERAPLVVDHLISVIPHTGVEMISYFPLETYRFGKREKARELLVKLVSPELKRREYPEVSYAALEAFAMGLMGIAPEASTRTVATLSRLALPTHWAELDKLPVWSNQLKIRHDGQRQSTLANLSGEPIVWEARFYTDQPTLQVNGAARTGKTGKDIAGRATLSVTVPVKAGEQCTVSRGE
jgi:hypothetical protein